MSPLTYTAGGNSTVFKSPFATDIATLRDRLAAAETKHRTAQQALSEASLAAALSDDPAKALAPHRTTAADARFLVDTLRTALSQAQAKEDQRQRQLRADAWTTRQRAVKQHVSALAKHAVAYETALTNANSAYKRMIQAGQAIDRLLPTSGGVEFAHLRQALGRIPQEALYEHNALGCAQPGVPGGIPFPGTTPPRLGHFDPDHPHVPLHDRLRTTIG